MKKSFLFLVSFLMVWHTGSAQQDLSLYRTGAIPQVTYVNPSFVPDSKVNVGLPGISSNYFSLSNSGFHYSHAVEQRPDDSLELNMDGLIDKLADLNYLSTATRFDLLHVGIKVKKNYFTFNVTQRMDARFMYPKDMIKLVWEGNGGDFLGERASLDGLGVDYSLYNEFGLGYSREINDKLTVGGRFKYLEGIQNIWTEESELGLTTDEEDFAWTVDGSMSLRSSGVFDTTSEGFTSNDLIGTGNSGFSVDIGGQYELTDKINISASVLDLGYIKWTKDLQGYVNEEVEFRYEGVDINELYGEGGAGDTSSQDATELLMDSLDATFEVEESNEAYKTPLSPQIYLGGSYELTKSGTVGALLYGRIVRGKLRSGLSLSYNHKIGRWLSVTGDYSIYHRNWINIGGGFAINGGPVQFYVMSDNLLGAIIPHKTRNLHLRFGINLTFGREKKGADEEEGDDDQAFLLGNR